MNIDIVEAASGGPFRFRHNGETYLVMDPADVDFQIVLLSLQEKHVPGCPGDMPSWKARALLEAWAAHYDLPDYASANRLAYLVDHYRSALVADLQTYAGADLGQLWRARRWRTLLDIIDHLPGHSWYNASVANDEEHTKMVAESLAARKAEGDESADSSGPPMHTWSPEVAKLTEVVDAVRGVRHAIIAVNSKKAPDPPEPSPRPKTLLEAAIRRAEHDRKKSRHDALVKRMLPHKR